MKINLTFSGQMGQYNPIKHTHTHTHTHTHIYIYIYISLLSERGNTILQWEYKLNCAMATAENWHLRGHTPKAKWYSKFFLCSIIISK